VLQYIHNLIKLATIMQQIVILLMIIVKITTMLLNDNRLSPFSCTALSLIETQHPAVSTFTTFEIAGLIADTDIHIIVRNIAM